MGRKYPKLILTAGRIDRIKAKVNPVMQYGIANARMPDKVRLMDQKPDLMSFAFNAHDEWFQPDPNKPPKEIYAIHPRDELRTFLQACLEKGVKPEVEAFHTGAFFNLLALRKEGLLEGTVWTSLFFWPGGCWMPPTNKALIHFIDHLPDNCNFNVSSMDYNPYVNWQLLTQVIILGGHVRVGFEDNPYVNWQLLTQVIILGGHVRVGFEDNPYLAPGVYAKTNAELVEKIVRIAREVGREIASPDEARKIIGVGSR